MMKNAAFKAIIFLAFFVSINSNYIFASEVVSVQIYQHIQTFSQNESISTRLAQKMANDTSEFEIARNLNDISKKTLYMLNHVKDLDQLYFEVADVDKEKVGFLLVQRLNVFKSDLRLLKELTPIELMESNKVETKELGEKVKNDLNQLLVFFDRLTSTELHAL